MNYNFFSKLAKLTIPNIIISLFTRAVGFFLQNVKSHPGVIFDPKNQFEGKNILLSNTRVYASKVGRCTYISSNSLISKTKIGRYSSIGNWVSTGIAQHPTDFVSTHPLFHSSAVSTSLGFSSYDVGEKFATHKTIDGGYYVEIGSDVWIGDRVMIMDGVRIGDWAIVGAGSIVNKNVKPYEIVVGTPAKHLRYRLSPEKIEFLLALKWWNMEESWIKNNANLFSDIDKFNI